MGVELLLPSLGESTPLLAVGRGMRLETLLMFGINLTLMQILAWGMARHSAELEIWKMMTLVAVVGVSMLVGQGADSVGGLVGAACFAMFAGWVLTGFVYELEVWQRGVLVVVSPIAAVVSFFSGRWLADVFYRLLLS